MIKGLTKNLHYYNNKDNIFKNKVYNMNKINVYVVSSVIEEINH